MPTFTWDIFVIDAPKINAFVLPSTDVFVYTGLLSLVEDDENLLASVLAHEICHVTERHSVESLGALALSGVVFDVLRGASWALTLSFPIVGDGLAACFNFLDRKVGQRAYSRKLETEADALGLEVRFCFRVELATFADVSGRAADGSRGLRSEGGVGSLGDSQRGPSIPPSQSIGVNLESLN